MSRDQASRRDDDRAGYREDHNASHGSCPTVKFHSWLVVRLAI